MVNVGLTMSKKMVFLFTYEDRPRRSDELLTIEVNDYGTPRSPFKVMDRFYISNTYPMANDYGRVEFWMALGERMEHGNVRGL